MSGLASSVVARLRHMDPLRPTEADRWFANAIDFDRLGEDDADRVMRELENIGKVAGLRDARVAGGENAPADCRFLPAITVRWKELCAETDAVEEDDTCPICLEPFVDDEEVMILRCCKFTAHKACMEKTALAGRNCPICGDGVPMRYAPQGASQLPGDDVDYLKKTREDLLAKYANNDIDVLKTITAIKAGLDRRSKRTRNPVFMLLDRWFDSHFVKTGLYRVVYNLLVQLLDHVWRSGNPPTREPSPALSAALDEMAGTRYFESVVTDLEGGRWTQFEPANICYRQHTVSATNWFLATSIAAVLAPSVKDDVFSSSPVCDPDREDILTFCLLGWARDVLRAGSEIDKPVAPALGFTPTTVQKLFRSRGLEGVAYVVDGKPYADVKHLVPLAFLFTEGHGGRAKEWTDAPLFADLNRKLESCVDVPETRVCKPKPVYTLRDDEERGCKVIEDENKPWRELQEAEPEAEPEELLQDLDGGGGRDVRARAKAGGGAIALVVLAVLGALFV